MERPQLPDGHRPTGRQFEIELLDPVDCPAGHPFRWGVRTGEPQSWRCACGQLVVRRDGQFVAG